MRWQEIESGTIRLFKPANFNLLNAKFIVESVNDVLELGELTVERDALLASDEAKSAMIADLKEQNRSLRYALAEAAIPLEAFNLIGNDTMKFAPSTWDEIQNAIKSIREALFGKT